MKSINIDQQFIPSLLNGTKTRHTQLIDPQPFWIPKTIEEDGACFINVESLHKELMDKCPYKIGEKVWVPESYYTISTYGTEYGGAPYESDYDDRPLPDYKPSTIAGFRPEYFENYDYGIDDGSEWLQPADTMPEWAARIWLEITVVRVQMLMDISEEEAKSEGFYSILNNVKYKNFEKNDKVISVNFDADELTAKSQFRSFWNQIHGEDAFDKNSFVYGYEFRRLL